MPVEDGKDYRYVVLGYDGHTASVFSDEISVGNVPTGTTIRKTYVPDWWHRDYNAYVGFVVAVQRLYAHNSIIAIRLVKSVSDLGLRDAKNLTDYLCGR